VKDLPQGIGKEVNKPNLKVLAQALMDLYFEK